MIGFTFLLWGVSWGKLADKKLCEEPSISMVYLCGYYKDRIRFYSCNDSVHKNSLFI